MTDPHKAPDRLDRELKLSRELHERTLDNYFALSDKAFDAMVGQVAGFVGGFTALLLGANSFITLTAIAWCPVLAIRIGGLTRAWRKRVTQRT